MRPQPMSLPAFHHLSTPFLFCPSFLSLHPPRLPLHTPPHTAPFWCAQLRIMAQWGFVLRLTKASGVVCFKCRWTQHCSGCHIPPSTTPGVLLDGATLVIDWDPVCTRTVHAGPIPTCPRVKAVKDCVFFCKFPER